MPTHSISMPQPPAPPSPTTSTLPSTLPGTVQTVAPLPHQLTGEISSTGYLESWALGYTLVVVAAAVAVGWAAAGVLRRRRHRRLLPRPRLAIVRIANAAAVLVVGLIGALVLVNSYAGYVPSLHALLSQPHAERVIAGRQLVAPPTQRSSVVRLDIPAPKDGVKRGPTYVYLPPGYGAAANADVRYPVVYLIHGYVGHSSDWVTAGRMQHTMDLLLAQHYIGPMIVVAPTASTGFFHDDECLNAPGRFMLENYLAFNVVHAIDHTFRTVPSRRYRAIGGMSSGAYCALNVGLHHLHRFSVILSIEPYADPGRRATMKALGGDIALERANSPSFYLPLWTLNPPVAAFLDTGGNDRTTTRVAHAMADEFAARGMPVALRISTGLGHTWRAARAGLPYALIFAWQHFGTLPAGGSDAADAAQFATVLNYARLLTPAPKPTHTPKRPSATPHPTTKTTASPKVSTSPRRTTTPRPKPSSPAPPPTATTAPRATP